MPIKAKVVGVHEYRLKAAEVAFILHPCRKNKFAFAVTATIDTVTGREDVTIRYGGGGKLAGLHLASVYRWGREGNRKPPKVQLTLNTGEGDWDYVERCLQVLDMCKYFHNVIGSGGLAERYFKKKA